MTFVSGLGQIGKMTILLFFCMINMLFMHYYVFFGHYIEDVLLSYVFVVNFLTVLFDVFVVILIYLLLSWGRLKLSLMLTYGTTLIWSFVNVFYVRFFNQYIPLSVISMADSLTDQAVVKSMLAGFQWVDLYFPISLALFAVIYRMIGTLSLGRKRLVFMLLTPVTSFACIFLVYSSFHFLMLETRGNMLLYKVRMSGLFYGDARNSFPNMTRFETGSIRVLGGEIYDLFHQVELTDQQRKEIASEAAGLSQRVTNHVVNPAIKNVIIIVLESFLSSPIDLKVDGKEITPFLNILKRDSDTYYNGHVAPNITMGESGDGQFIIMTGLLPLRDKLTVGEAKLTTFPAFPRLLAKHYGTKYTEIVMPSPPMVWVQEQMNPVYGIDHMFCNRDVLGDVVDYLNDEQIFTMAMRSPLYHHQPFFSLLLNYSTHQPYRSPIDESLVLNEKSLPNGYLNYLIACHYTDAWLRKYFDFLKQKDIYDNSLIVITADHHAHLDALGMKNQLTKELPLFIIHGKIDKEQAWAGPMNQLDIFTTLLDVLGIESDWHGLGHTVLSKDYQNSVTEKAWALSELIIKSKYFEEGSNHYY